MIEFGDQPREHSQIIHRRQSWPESTLRRAFLNRVKTAIESQLVVLGQAVTGESTPKATLFEPCLFRKFVANPLLTESYGKGIASGVKETEKDSNLDMRRRILKPNHDGPHDAHHLVDQPGP